LNDNLNILTPLLAQSKADLDSQLLPFIYDHLGDNHLFYHKLRFSGMIEVLILKLTGPYQELSLKILRRF
jgi:hypothetical protein